MDDIFLHGGTAGNGSCEQMGLHEALEVDAYYMDLVRRNWRENIVVPRSHAQGAPLGGLAAAGLARSSGETLCAGRDITLLDEAHRVGYTPLHERSTFKPVALALGATPCR